MNKAQKIEYATLLEERIKRVNLKRRAVVGLVNPDGKHTHSITQQTGTWSATQDAPSVYLPSKLERVLTSTKRFIVLIGGRGSAKSISMGDIALIDARDTGAKTYCLREYQSSIRNSMHSLLKNEIERLQLSGFEIMQHAISVNNTDAFEFAGLSRNVDSIKSAYGFRRYLIEEAQSISQESLRALTPTARARPNKGLPGQAGEAMTQNNVSIVFIANPGSTEDPFSQRFIVPFLSDIEREGYYEDDLHLIVQINYTDNPWFKESGLEPERVWDFEHLPRALYDHIWLGKFNDSVDSALIMAEWFDACIDSHVRLGFQARGALIASHDPSDSGPDNKGYSLRHGNVFTQFEEMDHGTVNEGGHWAAQLALASRADYFTWDCDGMGVALSEQMSADFMGKPTQLVMYRGSESPDDPKSIYLPALKAPVAGQKTIEETFANKRAQYYFELRDRCYRTYRAVVHGEYHDPDTLISFDSGITLLSKLRSELCRIPTKPSGSGLLGLYTKAEMRSKFKLPSPNLADCAMMSMRYRPPTVEPTVITFRRKW